MTPGVARCADRRDCRRLKCQITLHRCTVVKCTSQHVLLERLSVQAACHPDTISHMLGSQAADGRLHSSNGRRRHVGANDGQQRQQVRRRAAGLRRRPGHVRSRAPAAGQAGLVPREHLAEPAQQLFDSSLIRSWQHGCSQLGVACRCACTVMSYATDAWPSCQQ